jgi:hypothetical protein
MTNPDTTPQPSYEFAEKYDPEHAKKYFEKHNTGFWRRLSTWREIDTARKALVMAGRPQTVLDLPCGTGRFWAMLAEEPGAQDLCRRQQPEHDRYRNCSCARASRHGAH